MPGLHGWVGWLTEDPPTLVTEPNEEILRALCGPITGLLPLKAPEHWF